MGRGSGTEIPQCSGLLAHRDVLSFGSQHRDLRAFRPKPLHMQKKLLFIPGPVVVSEPVLAAMAKPLINHRGPEYARLLHSIADRIRSSQRKAMYC
jgi:hypothetical protein